MPARKRKPQNNEPERKEQPRQSAQKNARSMNETKSYSGCCLVVTAIFCLIQTLVVTLLILPSPIKPVSIAIPQPPAKTQSLPITNENALRFLEHELVGPESMVSYGDYLYTSTYNKGVVRINKATLEMLPLPPLGMPPCGSVELEPSCGRPLGIRIHQGFLYVLDAYLGMFKYDLRDLTKPASQLFDGVTFGNDFAISSQGMIYYSDSSKTWARRDFPNLVLENSATGMLIQYNESSGEKTVLSDDLSFANGVELSHAEDFVFVAETNRARLARYWLRGPKKGFWDYFHPNLPGFPDNVRRSTRGTYWVGMATARPSIIIDSLAEWPVVRSQLAKMSSIFPALRKYVIKSHGMLVEINNDGKIIRIFEDESGLIVPNVSEVEETVDGVLYLGSYALPYLTKLVPEQFH